MSAYSDWHCGAISDDEYRLAYAFDRGEDHGEIPYADSISPDESTINDPPDIDSEKFDMILW